MPPLCLPPYASHFQAKFAHRQGKGILEPNAHGLATEILAQPSAATKSKNQMGITHNTTIIMHAELFYRAVLPPFLFHSLLISVTNQFPYHFL
jgi:hypothetical protein